MKLVNTRRPLKGKHNRNDNETKKRVRIGYCFAKVPFFSLDKNIPTSRIRLPSLRWERRTVADASVAFIEDGDGEGDSAKSEIMLLRPSNLDCGEVGFCDTTARYCRATTGVTLRLHTAF